MTYIIISFVFFLLVFTGIGVLSSRKAKSSSFDYLLAGQDVKPWLVALSAVATNNSGYMFIGMIGYTYLSGLSSIWLMVGWITGDLLGSMFIHKHLRTFSEKRNATSFGTVVSSWLGKNYGTLRVISGVLIVFFLGTYAAAQLVAGSKALNVILGWEMWVGAVIGAVIVVIYCFSGGIRASIWTDAAQSIVMIAAMALLLIFAIDNQGGLSETWSKLGNLEQLKRAGDDFVVVEGSNYMNWFETTTRIDSFWDPVLFIIGWFFAGLGVVGQPHIMIRFMAVDKAENIRKVRRYYYTWFIAFYVMTIGVGLLSRLMIPPGANFDSETALPVMAGLIFPNLMVGVVLAGIFAATISTADSLVLSCSASVTNEILPRLKKNYAAGKVATISVGVLALIIALTSTKDVFSLVVDTWAVLGCTFGPVLAVLALKQRPNQALSLAMMVSGFIVVTLWTKVWALNAITYSMFPGMITAFAVFFIGKYAFKAMVPEEEVDAIE